MSNLVSTWVDEIETGRGGWIRVYKEAFGQAISDPSRFFSGLKLFGTKTMFEALIITYGATIQGDPLPYLMKVAYRLDIDNRAFDAGAEKYSEELTKQIAATRERNKAVADKLKRAKEMSTEV